MQAGPQSSAEDEDDAIFAEINVTPLTDVFLVLLIIFMVVASGMVEAEKQAAQAKALLSEKALAVQTPQGTGDSALVVKDVVISVAPDGTLYVEAEQVTLDGLPEKLKSIEKGVAGTRVVIRGDENAQYKLIMQVIAKVRAAGLTDVALSSRPSTP